MTQTELEALATTLHNMECRYNHTDGCGWFYEQWGEVRKYSTRDTYLKRAKVLCEKFTPEQIQAFLTVYKTHVEMGRV